MMVINQFVKSLFTAGKYKDSEVPFDNYFNVHIKNTMSSQSVPLFCGGSELMIELAYMTYSYGVE
jgi:hypothetical protein